MGPYFTLLLSRPFQARFAIFAIFAFFAFCLNRAQHSFLRFLLLPFVPAKKIAPFWLFAYFAFCPRQCCNTLQNSTTRETGLLGKALQIIFKRVLSLVELL